MRHVKRNIPDRRSLAMLCLLISASAGAQQRLNFLSCPIVRDTATVPCWLTEHEGELYYMGIQTDVSAEFHPPYLGHKVLVEATVASDRERICGGVVLDPIRISVMPELDAACNTILPAEDKYTIDFNPRPPGPSGGRLAFAPAPGDTPPPPREPPSGPKTFHIYFDVDRGVAFRHPQQLVEIHEYARAIDARRITVLGNRGATLLSDGSLVTESAGIAERRSRQVAELLRGLGAAADIRAEHSSEPVAADGIDDWTSRSVVVRVEP